MFPYSPRHLERRVAYRKVNEAMTHTDASEFSCGHRETIHHESGLRALPLGESTQLHVPAPPGFTIRFDDDGMLERQFMDSVRAALASIEHKIGHSFANPRNPLLVAVRSAREVRLARGNRGILNVGLNDEIVESLIALTNNPRFVYDCYRRFLVRFSCETMSTVTRPLSWQMFESIRENLKAALGVMSDSLLGASDLKRLCNEYKCLIRECTGKSVPENPMAQLEMAAIAAAGGSQENAGVIVQSMVFGNLGENCGAGVAWSQNPTTGVREDGGMFLENAQGDDLRSRGRVPCQLGKIESSSREIGRQLRRVRSSFQRYYGDDYVFDFTLEHGTVYVLGFSSAPLSTVYSCSGSQWQALEGSLKAA